MSYTVNKTNVSLNPIVVSDNTLNTETSLTLVGKNWSNYGGLLDTNFVHLLENFAFDVSPANAITGQLWYDTSKNILQVFNGDHFKSVVTVYSDTQQPDLASIGDLWLDISTPQTPYLKCYTNTGWTTIGPPAGTAQLNSEILTDAGGNSYPVLSMTINSVRYAILSIANHAFTPIDANNNGINGFATIAPGFNIANTAFVPNNRFVGQATNSDKLTGLVASQFMRTDVPTFTTGNLTVHNNVGLVVGVSNNFKVGIQNADTLITNQVNAASMRFRITNAAGAICDAFDINGDCTVTVSENLVVGGNMLVPSIQSNGMILTGNVSSTTPYTGTLRVWGGVGISGNINTGGQGTVGNVFNITNYYSTAAGQNTTTLQSKYSSYYQNMNYDSFTHTFRVSTMNRTAVKILDDATVQFTAANGSIAGVTISNNLNQAGYGGTMALENTNPTATNPRKFFRISPVGEYQIRDDQNTYNLLNLTDGGNFTVYGNIQTPVERINIYGGTNGQWLKTYGNGTVHWETIDSNSASATRWQTARNITLTGDTRGTLDHYLDGTQDVIINTTTSNLHGVTVSISGDMSGTATFAGNAITINTTLGNVSGSGITTYYSVNVNAKGLVTGGTTVPGTTNVGATGQVGVFSTGNNIVGSSGFTYNGNTMAVTGAVSATGDVIAFSGSDRNLKTNIEPITDAIDKVKQITGVTFDWAEHAQDLNHNRREAGVIAQEMQAVLPEIVTTRDDGYLAVRYERINALLIQAVKELTARVEQLEAERNK
jgi:Chaperone of endosialidase